MPRLNRFFSFFLLLGLAPVQGQFVNVALNKPTSGDTALGFPTSNGVDGSTATFTHADNTQLPPNNPFWQVDLQQPRDLTRIEITDRADGCCAPNRLNGSEIRVFDANDAQIGETVPITGLSSPSSGQTLVFSNGGFGWPSARRIRVDGYTRYFQFSELGAFVGGPGANDNIAVGRPVIASAATYPAHGPALITDGNRETFSHPDTGAQSNFFYQIDLGATHTFDRLVLYNRNDGCCPDRLSNYRVQILADNNGGVGPQNWSGAIRVDGSNSGVGGSDIIRAVDGVGTFGGRFVRISNIAGLPYNPQIAELEVFSAPSPKIRFFKPDDGNINAGGTAVLSWLVENFSSLTIDQGVGSVTGPAGSVAVSPAATRTYTLTATSDSGTSTSAVTIGVNQRGLAPLISEFLADNEGGIEDEDGDNEDWLEIANPNVFTLNLAGLFLTDDPAALTKWQIPSAAIDPGGYLVIFASNKRRSDPGGILHTNFKLAKINGYLGLVANDGVTVLQQFAPAPAQFSDKSYGRDATGQLKYFQPPTPGAANGAGYAGVVADTQFSVPRGVYSLPQSVAIASATPDATIRFTMNNTEPTLGNGSTYSAPLMITGTTVLRAAAFKTDYIPTNVDTQTYLFLDQVAAGLQAATATADRPNLRPGLGDLPSLSIVTPGIGAINDTSETPISIEFLNSDNTPGFQANAGVVTYGGAFTNFAKKSFRVYFRGDYGTPRLEYPPLFARFERGMVPVTRFDQLELRSGSHDMAMRGFYMSNTFTDDTMLDMGNLNPHSRYVHLYLNGAYHGMYHLRERWNAKMLADYLGGPDSRYEAINGNYNVGGWPDPGSPYDGDGAAWARIKSLRNDYSGVRPYLDVRHFVDYMIMWMFGNAEDEYRAVGPIVPGSGFKWMLNDADGWLSINAWDGNSNNTARSNPPPGRRPGDGPGSLFSTLLASTEYRTLVADRIQRHLVRPDGVLTAARNNARLTERTTQVERAIVAECARWGYRTPSSWKTARDQILNSWFPSRTGEVLNQFRTAGFYPALDAPTFSQPGGTVSSGFALTMSAPAGSTVFHTVDGTDPRLPGGAVATRAIAGAATTITRNTIVKARATLGTQWSAMNEAFFQVDAAIPAGALAITELNFHPENDPPQEFIELGNVSGAAINLRGIQFTAGIEFSFPDNRDVLLAPGERLLLVENQLAFENRYGIDLPIAGVYRGKLDDAGETLVVETPAAIPLLSFTFHGSAPWPAEAGGAGRTLVLANRGANVNHDDPLNWRASIRVGGTPGTSDAATFAGNDLLEYALGNLQPFAEPAVIRTPDGTLELTHHRNLAADDIAFTIESSSDLATWTSAAAVLSSQAIASDGSATMTWHIPADAGSARFFRIRATLRSP